nr:retrovirus-related Pol polyprotein from transposon TNT 1-94 [Tanacetum cinerariifolium]
MALGYQNPFYLKQAQKKQQSLYDGKVLLEKHDPPVVHDSEETLQLAQEIREKMKQLNTEIKPANYTKINHLSGVFVSQTAKSHEELYFSNDYKTANVSKLISIPNEEFSNDNTPSVACKFLNELKSTIVTLQRVVKHRMTLETHNWSSSAHQELHKIEAAKFVGDFKSLAKEYDESLAKHKALELEIERLLRAVVSQDNKYGTSVNTKFAKQLIVENLPKVGETHVLSKPVTSNSIPTPQESKVVKNDKVIAPGMFRINPFKTSREAKHVPNNIRASARTKPITVSQPSVITKKDVNFDSNGLSSTGIDNTKTKRPHPRSNTKNDRVPSASKNSRSKNKDVDVEEHHRNLLLSKNTKHMLSTCNNIKLDYQNVISKVVCAICCFKNMTRNLKLLINFVWMFMGTVRFGNDHAAAILAFGDLQWGNILITRVYFIEGLGHNFFSVGQFYDSDLEVAFRRNACFVRNLEGVDLLKRNRSTNLYTINFFEMASASPICLIARASSTKSWLWHQRLSHLQSSNIIRNIFVFHVSKEKEKEHLIHPNQFQIQGSDDYPRYTWVHFLRSKDEAPEVIKTFLKRITVLLQSAVIIIRTDNGTEFKNQVLKEYFDSVGISHQMSSVRTLQQNRVVERKNRTDCYCVFHSKPIHYSPSIQKTPYELINDRKPDISFLHVFGALCYPKNDREDIGKLGAKVDIGFFIGYSADSCAYRIFNRRTKKIMETMNVSFDELSAMAFEQRSLKPGLQSMTFGQISSGLDLTYALSTITTQQPYEGELDLLFEAMYDDCIGGQPSATVRTVPAAQEPQVRQTSTTSTSKAYAAPTPTNSSSLEITFPITSQDVEELNSQQQ